MSKTRSTLYFVFISALLLQTTTISSSIPKVKIVNQIIFPDIQGSIDFEPSADDPTPTTTDGGGRRVESPNSFFSYVEKDDLI